MRMSVKPRPVVWRVAALPRLTSLPASSDEDVGISSGPAKDPAFERKKPPLPRSMNRRSSQGMMLKRCSRKSRAGSIPHRLIVPSILYRVVRPPTSVRFRIAHRTKRAERPPNAVAATPIALRASTVVPACTERASKVLMTFAAILAAHEAARSGLRDRA